MPRAEYFSVSHGSDPDDHLPVPRSNRYLWPGYSAGSTAAGTASGSMYAAQGTRTCYGWESCPVGTVLIA